MNARRAPNQIAAVEMILIRISYAADLPSPIELAKRAIEGKGEGTASKTDWGKLGLVQIKMVRQLAQWVKRGGSRSRCARVQ